MAARQHQEEGEDGEEIALLLRRPSGHDSLLDQQPMRLDESNAGPSQRYAYIAAQGSSRIHAGNSYVEQQHNYYGPEATPGEPAKKIMSLQTALAFPEMSLRPASIETAQAKTCKWIFETPQYRRWLDPASRLAHHGILWIKGKPGAGKSTIMKHILHTSQRKDDPGKFVSFFFNARGQGLVRSTEGLYRALLCQVVDSVPSLQDMVDPELRPIFKDQGWPLELLKDLFREAVRQYQYDASLTCCVDALDECDEDEVRNMLELFEDLGEMATEDELPFLVCFTSRHYPKITIAHVEEVVIDQLRGHQDDISEYVQRRLKLPHVEVALKEELVFEIREKSFGVFLWVVLVVGLLNKTGDRGNVHLLRNRLQEMPPNLRELFDDILERDQPDANFLPIIQWMLYSRKPLTAAELYFAVMISTDSLTETTIRWDEDVVNERVLRDFITTSSKGFLEIVFVPVRGRRRHKNLPSLKDRLLPVQFIHESVREFFLTCGLERLDTSLESRDQSVATASHQKLANWCLSYMQLSLSQHLFSIGIRKALPVPSVLDLSDLDSIPLLGYVLAYGSCYHLSDELISCDHVPEENLLPRSMKDGLSNHWVDKEFGHESSWGTSHSAQLHLWMHGAHEYLLQHAPKTPILAHPCKDNGVQLQTTGDTLHIARCKIMFVLLAKPEMFTSSCESHPEDSRSPRRCEHVATLRPLIDYGPGARIWTMDKHQITGELIAAVEVKDEVAVRAALAAMAHQGTLTGSLIERVCVVIRTTLRGEMPGYLYSVLVEALVQHFPRVEFDSLEYLDSVEAARHYYKESGRAQIFRCLVEARHEAFYKSVHIPEPTNTSDSRSFNLRRKFQTSMPA
jgi:hypothetical protein